MSWVKFAVAQAATERSSGNVNQVMLRLRLAWCLLWLAGCHAPETGTQQRANDASNEAPVDAEPGVVAAVPTPEGMRLVAAGTFTMGSDHGGEADEHPAHAVTLAAFWLDRTPVTNAAYNACVDAKVCRKNDCTLASRTVDGGTFMSDAEFAKPNRPVNGVSWNDAKTFCTWAGKRLPREAEYERAMRGDDGRKYAWGNDPPTPERAAFGRSLRYGSTDDVGTHPAGRGPFGHDDLAGNVWEWVEDAYDPYAYKRATAPLGIGGACPEILQAQDELRAHELQGFTGSNPIPTECERVLRGGGFNYDAPGLRATNRVHHPAKYRLLMAGFRCARDASVEVSGIGGG